MEWAKRFHNPAGKGKETEIGIGSMRQAHPMRASARDR
jgi:hypothetical protein